MLHMNRSTKDIQLRYEGFLQTPNLWMGNTMQNLEQFDLKIQRPTAFQDPISKGLRLGKLIERFVSHQIKLDNSISILAENIQIHQNKITLGELDLLLLQGKQPVHLEIIYKFYLYDERIETSELDRWIGPNRRDSLVQKLNKLTNKQLPIIAHEETQNYLNRYNLIPENIHQKVCFKAQLFVPFSKTSSSYPIINSDCIAGFYVNLKELALFKECKFYIPAKLDWLVVPKTDVTWLSYEHFILEVNTLLPKKLAPLCWMKKTNGEMSKFFAIWWD